jgi:hypothetical protein
VQIITDIEQGSDEWLKLRLGVATASNLFFRTIGGTISVGFLGGILAAVLLGSSDLPIDTANKLLGPDHGLSLTKEAIAGLAQVLSLGLVKIFWVIFILGSLAWVAGFGFPNVEFKKN